ncbi:MAG: AEC family transporter [Acutalibacteraceae bacterium]|nr:AEC family transporter [Acutalibacteraceae bacterium]
MEFKITIITVGIMLLYSLPGFALVKAKKIKAESISAFATVLMYVCQSCLVVYSFQQVDYSPKLFKEMLIFFALGLFVQSLIIITYYLIFRKRYEDVKYRIVTIAGVFGNCAFMGVPLLEKLLPDYPQAVAFSAVYSISMNLLGWTVASAIIANDKNYIKLKNFFLNPSVIALYMALPLFFCGIEIGGTQAGTAVFLLARMTTPLCMLIMGMRLASVPLKPIVTRKLNYLVLFLKQLIMPLLGLIVIFFLPIDTNMKLTFYIICCCPVASVVLNFSELLGQGQEMAANLVLLGTFSSIVTIPIMMIPAHFLF